MKNSTDQGFDQHYNVQVVVDRESRLVVGHSVSNHPTDREEAMPTVDAIPAEIGKPQAAALDTGYWSPSNVERLTSREIEPYIATGRDSHHQSWQEWFAEEPVPPAQEASLIVKMAYKLRAAIGKQLYGLQVHRGAGDWPRQGNTGLSPVLVAGCGGGSR
jgi:hypothetical protein